MVAIAREESAQGVVKVGGSDFFRKKPVRGAACGPGGPGLTRTEFERERLIRAVAARRGGKPSDSAPAAKKEKPLAADKLIVGKLVDHGPAPYQHNPKAAMSYFVRLETDKGDRDIWGVDLEQAFRQSLSTPGVGDQVGIERSAKSW